MAQASSRPAAVRVTSASSGNCLTPPSFKMPPNSAAALSTLPSDVQAYYSGYANQVIKSPYLNFKPKHKAPWLVGFDMNSPADGWNSDVLSEFQSLAKSYEKQGLVSGYITTHTESDVGTQIQQIRSMIEKGVSIIFLVPESSDALNGVIKQAFDDGVVVVTVTHPVTSPYAINFNVNLSQSGAIMALGLARILHSSGNIYMVEGIQGSLGSIQLEQGGQAVFAHCPNIHVIANIYGQWSEAVAKTVTLQALISHPQPVDGVWDQGAMMMGIVSAFQQSGRKVPPVTDGNPEQNGLAYWHEHRNSFTTVDAANPPIADMAACWRIAMGVVKGYGLKVSTIVTPEPTITSANLDQWWKPSYTEASTGTAEPPLSSPMWLPDKILNQYFAHPGTAG